MKNGKKWLALSMSAALLATPIYGAGYSKNQIVQYGGTNLVYNDEDKTDAVQPIVIEGTTYLPIRAMSNLLGLNIGWSQASKTVTIDGVLSTSSSLQAELQAKNYEITMLRRELETLRGQTVTPPSNNTSSSNNSSSSSYDTTYGTDILGTEITATRRALEDEFSDYFDDIEFDFSLSLSGSRLKLLISIDGTSENREFRRLSSSKVKAFVEDVCEEIRDRHEDIAISGEIENDDTGKTLYTFSYSKGDNLSFSSSSSSDSSSSSSSYSRDEEGIKAELERIVTRAGKVYINDYDSSIGIDRFYVREMSDSTIYASLYLDLSSSESAKDAWNRNTGYNNNDELRRQLSNFSDDLKENYNIKYTIYDYRSGTTLGTYDYDDNRIDLNQIS